MAVDKTVIRRYLRDFAAKNRLLGEEEFSDDLIDDAITFVINDFNTSPPYDISIAINSHPDQLMKAGIVMYLLEEGAFGYSRDHLTYQAGNVSLDDNDKSAEYMNFANRYRTIYEREKKRHKVAININRGWGII
jgi:hypothetical protein